METQASKMTKAIENVVFDVNRYKGADSLQGIVSEYLSTGGVLTFGLDAHQTITLVSLMRRHASTDGVLFGEKVSQAELSRRFGSYIDEDGKEVPNVSKGRLSKASKLATDLLADVLGGTDDPVEALVSFVDERRSLGKGVSIETLYNELSDGVKPKGWTLSGAVATLIAKSLKEGIALEKVLSEVVHQIEEVEVAPPTPATKVTTTVVKL